MSAPDEEPIQSIASLRSRFESLAAGSQPRKVQATPRAATSNASPVLRTQADVKSDGAGAADVKRSGVASRSMAALEPDSSTVSRPGATGPVLSEPALAGSEATARQAEEDVDQPAISVKSLRDRFNGAQPSLSSEKAESSSSAQRRAAAGQADKDAHDEVESHTVPMTAGGSQVAADEDRSSNIGSTTPPGPLEPNSIEEGYTSGEQAVPRAVPSKPESTGFLSIPHSRPLSATPSPSSSRPHSPSRPPEPDRRTKPAPRFTASPTPSSSAQISRGPSPEPAAPLTISRAPSLPVRKTSTPPVDSEGSPLSGPPPIPSNRPVLSAASLSRSASTASRAPELPSRSRGHTVAGARPAAAQPIPPRLPVRSGTLDPNMSSLPPRPIPSTSTLMTSPGRPLSSMSPPDPDYMPPPPPTRSLGVSLPSESAMSSSPTRQPAAGSLLRRKTVTKTSMDTADSEEEDEAEEAGTAGLNSTVKRLLEEFPDSTHANRRPPRFVPDVRIRGSLHVHAFAAHGRFVCTGSHHVRVYDTLMSEDPIFVVELRDTGLELRLKDSKITAMCFRPAACTADAGRYLWCGTKDGHLWELDIRTGGVTDTRAFAHASSVVGIYRYKKWLVSLEEHGKAHVFMVGRLEDGMATEDVSQIPVHCRTIRVSERFNFAKLINGRLWTSVGPASRSTTSSASKGPTIRIYEPCVEGAVAPAKTLFTTEWTGAVTSATTMPFQPGKVFLGHEGGYISIWSEEEATCLQVLKVSTSDILALEGAGDRLWAGNRKGQIHVYDIAEQPWQTTNLWTAHSECPVQCLLLDPYSVEQAGRFTIWSQARDGLRAWDALRSVDWVDRNMTLREAEYCEFRRINVLVCSWNIDSAKPSDLTGSIENTNFFDQLLGSVDSPDVIVFGFQEVIPLTDKKLTASEYRSARCPGPWLISTETLLFGSKHKDSGGTADKVSHAYRQWLDKITSAVRIAFPDTPYVNVHSESLVGLFTCGFVKTAEKHALRDLSVCTVKRGIGNLYGNKGAIVARMVMDDTSMCFINVHLAAGQSQKASRTADLSAIMEDKAILPSSDGLPYVHGGDGTAISDHEIVILNGDLNYRIDQRREAVMSNIEAGELDYLLEHDQLRKEMRTNHAFRLRSFEEPDITFKPTYKYNTGTTDYDSSEKRRIPAWCDRILNSKSPRIQNLHYKRYETTISDHRPISAGYAVTLKAVDGARMNAVRKQVAAEWAREEARMLQDMEAIYRDLL